jgi:hypothetical protein
MNWLFLFSAAVILWLFSLLYLKGYIRKRTGPEGILAGLRDEIRQLEAVIDEKTEQNLQLLEERIGALRELIAEAEQRITIYNRELNRSRTEESVIAALSRGAVQAEPAAKPAADHESGAVPKPVRSLLDTLEVREIREETPGKGESRPGKGSSPRKNAGTGRPRFIRSADPVKIERPLRERAAELHRAGFSTELIAARLNITIAEAELYAALDSPNPLEI